MRSSSNALWTSSRSCDLASCPPARAWAGVVVVSVTEVTTVPTELTASCFSPGSFLGLRWSAAASLRQTSRTAEENVLASFLRIVTSQQERGFSGGARRRLVSSVGAPARGAAQGVSGLPQVGDFSRQA